MGWCDERDAARPFNQTGQQQQQLQGFSPRATQALELYRVCVAAGQWVRFSVEQRGDGEIISFSSKPPAAAATTAAANGAKKRRKKMNKRRAERQRKWWESRSSSLAAAASAQKQPPPAGVQQQQQQLQKQVNASFRLTHQPTYAAAAGGCSLPTQKPPTAAAVVACPQPAVAGKPAATARTMETRSSKKRKIVLSPVTAATSGTPPVNPSPPPSPVSSGIPQTDGAEEAPTSPPERERTPRSKTPSEVQPVPLPPPMTRLLPSPHHVLCMRMRCSRNIHSIRYNHCVRCHF